MSTADDDPRTAQYSGNGGFGRLAAEFDQLRSLSQAERERALAGLAVKEPGLTTLLRKLLAQHSDDPDELAAPDRLFAPGLIADALAAADSPLAPPPRIGAYRPIRELGRGGMGTVYLAEREHADFEQHVAIKVLRGLPGDRDLVQRFTTERRILAGLRHPNIAALIDGGATESGAPYVVMEFVDGKDLLTHCREQGIGIDARLRLFVKICRAVAHAHRALVVHRDLKPGNILVTAGGEPKLLDFGIAKLIGTATEPDLAVTRTGSMLLTPEYASPEQVRGEPVTTATDVYALGAILYELLCGRRAQPLANRSIETLVAVVCESTPPPPSTVVRHDGSTGRWARRLRGDLDTIVAVAMRKEPERRYHSAQALADDLLRFLDGQPVQARGDTFGYRLWTFARRHRFAVAAGSAMLAVLVAFAVTTALQNRTIARERDAAVTQRLVAEATSEFLVDLFGMASPDPERAETLRARELLDRGARRIEHDLSANPESRAALQISMGRAYVALGLYGAAEPLLTAARKTLASAARDTQEHRTAQFWSGVVAFHLGRFEAGEFEVRASLEPTAGGAELPAATRRVRLSMLSSWLREAGRYDEAAALLDEAERCGNVESAHLPPELRDLRLQRAGLLREQGAFDASLQLLSAAAAEVAAAGEAEHPRHLLLHRELGRTHKELEHLEEARAAFELTLTLSRRFAGEGHPDVDTALFELAMLEVDLGDFARAETLLREILARDLARFGEEHAYPAMVKAQLAMVVGTLDRPDEAEPLFLEALAVQRRVLPETNPELATTMANLGTFYHRNHRTDDALPLMREALRLRTALYDDDHPTVLTARNQVAVVLLDDGDAAGAEAEFRRVLEARRRVLGNHSETAGSLLSLAVAVARQDRPAEAATLFAESIAMFDATLPEGHPTRGRPRRGLGLALMKLDRAAEAEAPLREALALNLAAYGERHVETCYCESLVARCKAQQGRTQDAIDMLRALHERMVATHPGHPVQRQVRDELAALLLQSGDAAGAAALGR